MIFEDFKKKNSGLGLTEKDLKELFNLISLNILSKIYPNENDVYLEKAENADFYYDYLIKAFGLIKDKFDIKFDKKYYEAFNFIITYNQNFHYTVLFNALETDLKSKIWGLVYENKDKCRVPNSARFFLTDMIYCLEPERLRKIEMYKSFVNSNGKYLFE